MRHAIWLAAAMAASVAGAAAARERPRLADPSATACPQYGAGFVQVPGTATCVRLGGRVRAETTVASGHRSIPRDQVAGFSPSGSMSADVRTETGAGPLRAYVRARAGSGTYGGR